MSKTILIAGKNMPEAGNFTDGVAFSGRNIIVSGTIADSEETRKLTIDRTEEAYKREILKLRIENERLKKNYAVQTTATGEQEYIRLKPKNSKS